MTLLPETISDNEQTTLYDICLICRLVVLVIEDTDGKVIS